MIEPHRVFQPLDEARDAIRSLDDYETPADLARAVLKTWHGVEQSFRLLLRADERAADELRLAALSPTELPMTRLLDALRRRDLISLELAGTTHELERAAMRVERGEIRAADADLARQVVDRLRSEVMALSGASPAAVGADPAMSVATSAPEPAAATLAIGARAGGRPLRLAAAALALLVLGALVFALLRSLDDELDEATAAFAAGRLQRAEELFTAVLADAPADVTAHLYLARIHRRDGDVRAAAEYLRAAARLAPNDPDVRRELGYLFMDLDRPRAAADQYRRALEVEPADERAWIGLIQALRAAGDPEAETALRQAPPEVRALLTPGD